MIQALWLPGFFPTPINKLLGHHMAAHRLKKHDRETIGRGAACHGARIWIVAPRKVDLHFILPPKQRAWDEDAMWKSALDALVACELLRDDSPAWCRQGRVTYSRAQGELHGTLILLEDLA